MLIAVPLLPSPRPTLTPNTPKSVIDKINTDANEALRQPEITERLKQLSAEVFGGSVARTRDYMREEVARWDRVIKAAQIKVQ